VSRHSVILGVPGSQRVERFQESLSEACMPPAKVLSWLDFLNGASLEDQIRRGAIVRIESPGDDFPTWRMMVASGEGAMSLADALTLPPEPGRIRCGAQWYSGFSYALTRLVEELDAAAEHLLIGDPADIALMFDRARCQRHFADAGVAVPSILPPPADFDDLVKQTEAAPRVFLKSLHGASASGVMAIERGPRAQLQAWTALELTDGALFNNRRVRKVRDQKALAAIVNALVAEGAHLERWVPKGSLSGRTVDLRVLCIAGKPRHAVVRSSTTPLTSLQPGNPRGNLKDLQSAAGREAWMALAALCKQASRTLPRSLHVGLDVALSPDWKNPMVTGADAFGDLLPGVRSQDEDTGLAEINALLKRARAA